jgi:hypothetical protein
VVDGQELGEGPGPGVDPLGLEDGVSQPLVAAVEKGVEERLVELN